MDGKEKAAAEGPRSVSMENNNDEEEEEEEEHLKGPPSKLGHSHP